MDKLKSCELISVSQSINQSLFAHGKYSARKHRWLDRNAVVPTLQTIQGKNRKIRMACGTATSEI